MTGHVVDRLSAYLDDELDGIERGRVEKHLGGCLECARHLEELLAVDEATRRLELVEPPEGYFEALPGRLRERMRAEAPARKRFVVPAWTWAAAAAVLVTVIAPLVLVPSLMRARMATPTTSDREVEAPTEPQAAADRAAELALARDETESPAEQARPSAAAGLMPAPPERVSAAPPEPRALAPAGGKPARAPAAPREIEPAQGLDVGVEGGVPGGVTGGVPGRVEAPRPAALGAVVAAAPATVAARDAETADMERTRLVAQAARAEAKAQPLEQKALSSEAVEAPKSPAGVAAAAAPHACGETAAVVKGAGSPATPKAAEAVLQKAGATSGASETAAFDALVARAAETVEEARALREAWRAFATTHSDSRLTDEARVRVIETGLIAIRLGGDPADRKAALADASNYLARPDAAQAERVRRMIASLER